MALGHVFTLWTINGSDTSCCTGTNCCNGGGEWHRTFFSADVTLIAALRQVTSALPEWDQSGDFAGPHDPFTQSSETGQGSPRGQVHFFADDADAVTLDRNGVEGVDDPHIVELDNDYNIVHDSNPEGFYSNTYGRAEYKDHWNGGGTGQNRGDGLPTTFAGNGAPGGIATLEGDPVWSPACGAAAIDAGGVILGGTAVLVRGSGFTSGVRVHLRTRSAALVVEPQAISPGELQLSLPAGAGGGEAYLYVEQDGRLSNLVAVILP